MFVDSQPYGTSYTHPTKGLLILAGFNLLGMPNRYTIQEPKPPGTTDPLRRGTEDEPIYPGPIPPGMFPPLSDPAYEELRRRAEAERKRPQPRGWLRVVVASPPPYEINGRLGKVREGAGRPPAK